MPTSMTEAFRELAMANRIVANEGVLDAFGHVSMRHPDNPKRYFLSRSRAPELVLCLDVGTARARPVDQLTQKH